MADERQQPERPPEQVLQGFLTESSYDLEMVTAAAMRRAGFSVGQSVGVLDYQQEWGVFNPRPPQAYSGSVGRDVDVVSLYADEDVCVSFVMECKSFRRCIIGVLDLNDDMPAPRQELFVDNKWLGHFGDEVPSLNIPVDARGYRLVAGHDKEKERRNHDPARDAIRQVLDYVDTIPTSIFTKHKRLMAIPVLVVDGPVFRVRLSDDGKLTTSRVHTATVRVAIHRTRMQREVYVVSRDAIDAFANKGFEAAKAVVSSARSILRKKT
jgi:hypothetical protein